MYDLISQAPLIVALAVFIALAIVLGGLSVFVLRKLRAEKVSIVDQIDALLPQTQCGRCGYPGCRPYAQAIANGDAINKCPPGGQATINSLAKLLKVKVLPLDKEHGEECDTRYVAFIREAECIGCTKCIQSCPVDAILGAAKHMHTVIANECTGCELCVAPCPVDCIEMVPATQEIDDLAHIRPGRIPLVQHNRKVKSEIREKQSKRLRADRARLRFERRNQRLERLKTEKETRRQASQQYVEIPSTDVQGDDSRELIADAMARVQAKKAAPGDRRAQLERTIATAQSRVQSAQKRLADAEEPDMTKRAALQARLDEAERRLKEAQKKLADFDCEHEGKNNRPIEPGEDIGEN